MATMTALYTFSVLRIIRIVKMIADSGNNVHYNQVPKRGHTEAILGASSPRPRRGDAHRYVLFNSLGLRVSGYVCLNGYKLL